MILLVSVSRIILGFCGIIGHLTKGLINFVDGSKEVKRAPLCWSQCL